MQVTKQFAGTFDGNKAQIGNLTLFITKELISQVIGIPQVGEKWFTINTWLTNQGLHISTSQGKYVIG